MASDPVLDHAPREGVRTFTPRWRNSTLTDERMATLLPARSLPEGPLDFATAFGRVGPVVLEIGSGHGAAAIAYCAAHPEADLVAVEVHVPGVARMLAAAESAGVSNLWVHPGDAMPFLTDRVAPGSLAAVHLFFPDPWPKNKHAKRRFVQQHTLDLLASRLAPGGVLRIATDIAAYAAHARAQLAHHGAVGRGRGRAPRLAPGRRVRGQGRARRPRRHRAHLHPAPDLTRRIPASALPEAQDAAPSGSARGARSGGATAGEPVVGAHDLGHERSRGQPQPEDRDAQHHLRREGDLVLAQGVVDRVEGQGVVPAVDLDDQPDVLPRDVEVDPPSRPGPHGLPGRRRQPGAPAHPGEVELAQRVGPVADVADDRVEEPPTAAPAHRAPGRRGAAPGATSRCWTTRHDDQRGGPVGAGPLRPLGSSPTRTCTAADPAPRGGPDRRGADAP